MVVAAIVKAIKVLRVTKMSKKIGVAALKHCLRKTNVCFVKKAMRRNSPGGLLKSVGYWYKPPTGNAQRNIADKLGKAPAVPVC